MTDPKPLPDSILRDLHLAEFAAGFVSPETKAFLEKLEPLLPSLSQDGQALWADLVRLWPAVAPVFAVLGAHIKLGATVDDAVSKVSDGVAGLVPAFDQQDGAR